jgi:hypothetical protein
MPTIPQLQDVYLDRLENGLARFGAKRLTKRVKRSINGWYRRQYFMSMAHRDTKLFASKNEDIMLAVVFAAAVIGFAVAAVAAELMFTFFLTAYTVSEVSGASMLLLAMIAGGTLGVSIVWILSFLLNAISIGLMQGANNVKRRSILKTLRAGLQTAGKTSMVWVLLACKAAVPAIAVLLGTVLYITVAHVDIKELVTIIPYSVVAMLIGVEWVLMRNALAPVVAAHESTLGYKEIFARSNQLLRRRGQLFALSLHMLFVLGLSLAYGVSLVMSSVLGISQVLTLGLAIFGMAVYAQSLMTALYRKRRLARSS